MKKLIIDLNSIVSAAMLVGKDADAYTVDGVSIPTRDYGYSNFLNTYRKTLEDLDLQPMHTIAVFDGSKSRERRQRILPQYKEHRKQKPEEYYKEFNTLMNDVKQFIRHLGGIVVSAKRTEADDVIAHIAPKLDSVIWSKDKDLLSIGVPTYLNGQLYLDDTCDDKFLGLPRRHVRLYRTLVGDTGDFGPGTSAKGFGEKAFAKLWAEFGDEGLDELCLMIEEKRLDELEEDVSVLPELRKIIDSADVVYKTWRLAGWLKVPDYKLDWEAGYVAQKSDDTFDEDFFDYYGAQILVDASNFDELIPVISAQIMASDYVSLDIETDTSEESKQWIETLNSNVPRSTKVDVLGSKLCGLSITCGENQQHTYYFTVNHKDSDNIKSEDLANFILGIPKPIIAYNAGGFELPVLYKEWGEWLPDVYCAMIAQNYVDENTHAGLKAASMRWCRYKQQSYQDVTGGLGMSELTAKHVLSYGCDDTIMTSALFNFFETVMDIEGTFDTYAEVEQYPMYMVASSFVHGVNCDLSTLETLQAADKAAYDEALGILREYLGEVSWPGSYFEPVADLSPASIKSLYLQLHGKELKTRFRKVEKLALLLEDDALSEIVLSGDVGAANQYVADNFTPNIKFKVNSWKDKSKLLYTHMLFPVRFRSPITDAQRKAGITEGNPGTDEDCIKWAIHADADDKQKKVLKALLRCINYKTRNGLYYRPYPYLVHWSDGKLHPSLRQSSTTSRRFAPSGPNVNQIPKRSEEGKKVRKIIIPHHKDAVLISPDFSGQELRVGAHVTQDSNFLACYCGEQKKDLHAITAFEICQKQGREFSSYEEFEEARKDEDHPLHDVACDYRKTKAKSTNFLSQYVDKGGGDYTLSKKLQVDAETAQKFLEAKSAAFPGVDQWKDDYGLVVRTQKYAETLLGARKHVDKLLKFDTNHVLRSALNFRIQSSSAEMTKLVLAAVWAAEMLERYDARFYFPVHDEVVFSVSKDDVEEFCAELQPLMDQQYADMTVPIESSLAIGNNFGELDEIPWDGVSRWLADQLVPF